MIEYINFDSDEVFGKLNMTMNNLHNQIERKFVEINNDYDDWQIETDKGWSDISCVGKTIEYEMWEVITESGKKLMCADNHIVFDDSFSEIFVKDLNKDTRPDKIWVQDVNGQLRLELVVSVKNLGYFENMYDVQVSDTNHRYFTNGILSHNSIVLCNDAAEFVRRGKNTIFITCEMSPEKVARRISANLFDITLDEYDTLVESTEKVKKKLKNLSAMSMLPLGKLFIKEFPTGQCTVMDVERYVKEIEEQYKIKIDVVVIDYINIMCNYRNPNSENTYLKIKALAEDLRGLAVKYDFIVDTASQIGRNALDCSDIALTDVSESMGLAHTCDSIIGIIQTEEMRIGELDDETGKTIPYYWFKVLKIREGEGKDTKFRVNIIYNKMKLIEQTESIDMLSHFR